MAPSARLDGRQPYKHLRAEYNNFTLIVRASDCLLGLVVEQNYESGASNSTAAAAAVEQRPVLQHAAALGEVRRVRAASVAR